MIVVWFVVSILLAFTLGWLLGENNLKNLLFWNGGLSKRQLRHWGYTVTEHGYFHKDRFHHDPLLANAYRTNCDDEWYYAYWHQDPL